MASQRVLTAVASTVARLDRESNEVVDEEVRAVLRRESNLEFRARLVTALRVAGIWPPSERRR